MIDQIYLKDILSYDAETGVFTWVKTKSYKRLNGKPAGSIQLTGYIAITIDQKKYTAHRLAWLYTHGAMPEDCVDHINGVKTDNRICNLRLATRKENNHNTRNFSANESGYLGVSKYRNKWRARIIVDGKEKYLGYFKNKEDAHSAYMEAKRKYHPFFSM